MREIKFRTFEKCSKKMIYGRDAMAVKTFTPNYRWHSSEVEVMQYTGIKDESGVEIYEGDLLSVEFVFSGQGKLGPFPVTFEYHQWLADELSFSELVSLSKEGKLLFEVVGNIYEDPELLN